MDPQIAYEQIVELQLDTHIALETPKWLKFRTSGPTRGALLHKRVQPSREHGRLIRNLTLPSRPANFPGPPLLSQRTSCYPRAALGPQRGPQVGSSWRAGWGRAAQRFNSCSWPGCPPQPACLACPPAAGPVAPRMRTRGQGGDCAGADLTNKTRRIYELTRPDHEENARHQVKTKIFNS